MGTSQLSKASAEWKSKIGSSTAVAWSGGVGAKGREGVAAYLQRIEGSIEAPQVGEPAVEAKEEVVVGADMFR